MDPPPRSLRQAEKAAMEGNVESQDSQRLLEAYIQSREIGLLTTRANRTANTQTDRISQEVDNPTNSLNLSPSARVRDVNAFDDTHHGLISPVSDGRDATSNEGQLKSSLRRDAAREARAANARIADPPARPGEGLAPSTRKPRKMDASQSPTQSNGDRSSYGRYGQLSRPSSPIRKPQDDEVYDLTRTSQTSTHEDKTLLGDDPGAVNFDFDADEGTAKSASSVPEPSSLRVRDFGSLTRTQRTTTHNPFAMQPPQAPETPAHPPLNPFRDGQTALLPTSQLFKFTQFSSGAKLVSPTSSRPSPNDFLQNSISPNPPAVVSSPLKARGLRSTPAYMPTSSPQILPGTTSTGLDEGPSSPLGATSTKSPVIPDSQSPKLQRKRSTPQLMATYEPMSKSQERRFTSEVPPAPASLAEDEEDGDSDDSTTRRRKARSRKEAAFSKLNAISFPRPAKADDIEVPSTTKGKRTAEEDAYLAQCYGKEEETESGSELGDEVADSQKLLPKPAETVVFPDEESTQSDDGHIEEEPDLLPDTAPGWPAASKSPPLVATQPATADDPVDAIPETSPVGLQQRTPPELQQDVPDEPQPVSSDLPLVPRKTEIKEIPKFQSSPPALSTRSKRAQASHHSRHSTFKRREKARYRYLGSSRLVAGPNSREAAIRTTSKAPTLQRGLKIFEGMAFAISFQSKRQGETNDQYNNRSEFAATLEKKIKQAGGRVLEAGFDELFDVAPMKAVTGSPSSSAQGEAEIQLTEAGRSTGFTALIADGHSRKVKYMQALALGLPCLAGRWITTCLERGELVDWAPYLLCAGQSTFLGDAIRSRSLTPYDAATARLEDVIGQRTKLLAGSRILLVMKKSLEGKKMAYVFLARVLGASISRVYSTEEARVEIKAEEDKGTPFDWVYVDGKEDAGDLFATPGTGSGRKRKRVSAVATTPSEPPLKKIRTLSDELVIQSLILGRLIEEGEMEE
ncbi:hypothetical protein B0T16DRAFT_387565 [Cercophora newfieldiana]|uniref:BRCT domain-containing protein n=1 Tax=Cercophora newfieldiana TaxID=92897 RepID=A0AA39YJS9_9PEZI|nr:hypothetical protein B0T16DRAFT_387565 [Cercophora newfieldiana]